MEDIRTEDNISEDLKTEEIKIADLLREKEAEDTASAADTSTSSVTAAGEETVAETVPEAVEGVEATGESVEEAPVDAPASAEEAPADAPASAEEAPADAPASVEEGAAIIEAILFTMGDSVETERLSKVLGVAKADLSPYIDYLKEKYARADSGIGIIELEGAVQLCTKKEMYPHLIRIAKAPKKVTLTDALLETLSIVAYKQPITRIEIERIRGVNSDHSVNRLVELDLIQEIGRLDAPGRPLMFGTTEEFLRSFGVRNLDELPSLNAVQVEEFKREAEDEVNVRLDI